MIELNLLPEELKKKRKRIELPEIPIVPIAVGLVALLVGIQILLGGFIFFNKRNLKTLDKKWEVLAPKKKEFDTIKQKIATIGKKTKAIEGLMGKRISWSRLLNALSDSLTANIWLTDLTYAEKIEKKKIKAPKSPGKKKEKIKKEANEASFRMCTLKLSGSASGKGEETTAHIARFIRALKENEDFFKDFDDIELVSIKKGIVEGQDVMDFTLVCKFKPKKIGS